MKKTSSLPVILAMALSACATDDPDAGAKTGALVGTLAGAVASEKLEDEDKIKLAGMAIGAIAGAMVGSYMDEQQKALEQSLAEERRKREVEIERLKDETLKLYLQNEVFFDFDSAEIKGSAEPVLNKVAEHLVKYPQTAVHVIGHTDSKGSSEYNLYLSERRASSVATLLNRQGVPASRIRIEGRGENEPRVAEENEAARQRNRRVEIYVRPIVEGKEDVAYESPRY